MKGEVGRRGGAPCPAIYSHVCQPNCCKLRQLRRGEIEQLVLLSCGPIAKNQPQTLDRHVARNCLRQRHFSRSQRQSRVNYRYVVEVVAPPSLLPISNGKPSSRTDSLTAVSRAGGSSGIGLATVKLLLSLGAFVVAGDINEPPVPCSDHLAFQKTDVTSWADLSALFKKAKQLHGRIDHVFANAGISTRTNYLEENLDENGDLKEPSFEVLDVNLRGVLNTATLGLHYLKPERQEGGGSIVLTASSTSEWFPSTDKNPRAPSPMGLQGCRLC